jgi:hypothetical protein
LRRTSRDPCEPVGAKEIAERLGVRMQTVHMWRYREVIPEPRWVVSGQPCWNWRDIDVWVEQSERREVMQMGPVHVAGKFDGQRQSCKRCGKLLPVDPYSQINVQREGTLLVERHFRVGQGRRFDYLPVTISEATRDELQYCRS